ncbi:hypothetical protein Nmel_016156, partial [Mimus melanotis]
MSPFVSVLVWWAWMLTEDYQQTGCSEAFKEKKHTSLAKESKKHLNINNSTLSQKDKIKICKS